MDDKKPGGELITLEQAAELAGCSRPTLTRAIRMGLLEAQKFGNVYVTTKEAVTEWLTGGGYHPNKKRR